MKKAAFKILPWIITVVALYIAFRGVAFGEVLKHAVNASPPLLFLAFALTCGSYLLRSRRWQYLFMHPSLRYFDSIRALMLGFFMNNILPARTGEFVRAHAGAKLSGESRTLVLATIVSERLADGLTLSVLFVAFSLHSGDQHLSKEFLLVAYLFGAVSLGVLGVLLLRKPIFAVIDRIHARVHNKFTTYLVTRLNIFVNGLAPLFAPKKIPSIVLSSLAIWVVELGVYVAVADAYKAELDIGSCVLFLVAVNFSSLIPAAPGGVGVIEAVGTAALTSIGVDKAHALAMVLTQHILQYVVVGIPGAFALLTWKGGIKELEEGNDTPQQGLSRGLAE